MIAAIAAIMLLTIAFLAIALRGGALPMPSLKTSHRWVVAHNDINLERELSHALGVAPLVARIMVAHGIESVEEGHLFITPSL